MGLSISHNCYKGTYSSFNAFRDKLCMSANLGNLVDYIGFGGNKEWDMQDPLSILLNHSDCDGDIHWKDCKLLADRLTVLLPNTEQYSDLEMLRYTQYGMTKRFIDGLLYAHKNKEDICFS